MASRAIGIEQQIEAVNQHALPGHTAFGLSIDSERPIPGLVPSFRSLLDPDLVLIWRENGESLRPLCPIPFYPDEQAPSSTNLSLSRDARDLFVLFTYPDQTEFLWDKARAEITARWVAPYTPEDVATYFLGPVLGYILSATGSLVLHASAVLHGRAAVAFSGDAGVGKSTLAAVFALSGSRVLTDDVMALDVTAEGALVRPAYPRVRLWPTETVSLPADLPRLTPNWDKRYLQLDEQSFCDTPAPLRVIYLIQRSEERSPSISEADGSEGFVMLVANSYAGRLLDRSMRAHEFELLTHLLRTVELRVLRIPNDLERLIDVCDLVRLDADRILTLETTART